MNVTLLYHQSSFSFDVSKTKLISYIEEIAAKVFGLTKDNLTLFFHNHKISKSDILIQDYFTHDERATIQVDGLESLCPLSNSAMKTNPTSWSSLGKRHSYFNASSSKKRSYAGSIDTGINSSIFCNSCIKKDGVFYCRECNMFLCSTCKTKEHIHENHKLFRFNASNIRQSTLMYKRDLINDIKKTERELGECSLEIDDNLINSEANEVILAIKKLMSKRDEICQQLPTPKAKSYTFDLLMNEVYELFPNDDYVNEPIDSVFSTINSHERELMEMQEEIKKIKMKYEFKQMILLIISNTKSFLEKSYDDIDKIHQNSIDDVIALENNIKKFLQVNTVKYSKEKDMMHKRIKSFNEVQHNVLPVIMDKRIDIIKQEDGKAFPAMNYFKGSGSLKKRKTNSNVRLNDSVNFKSERTGGEQTVDYLLMRRSDTPKLINKDGKKGGDYSKKNYNMSTEPSNKIHDMSTKPKIREANRQKTIKHMAEFINANLVDPTKGKEKPKKKRKTNLDII